MWVCVCDPKCNVRYLSCRVPPQSFQSSIKWDQIGIPRAKKPGTTRPTTGTQSSQPQRNWINFLPSGNHKWVMFHCHIRVRAANSPYNSWKAPMTPTEQRTFEPAGRVWDPVGKNRGFTNHLPWIKCLKPSLVGC